MAQLGPNGSRVEGAVCSMHQWISSWANGCGRGALRRTVVDRTAIESSFPFYYFSRKEQASCSATRSLDLAIFSVFKSPTDVYRTPVLSYSSRVVNDVGMTTIILVLSYEDDR